MAVNEKQTQKHSKFVIGGNVILAIAIFWAIVVLVNLAASRLSPPAADMTRTGQFSLSKRTIKLIKHLKTPIRLTALYRVTQSDDKTRTEQEKEQKQRVGDLLKRYAGLSKNISCEVIDPLTDTKQKAEMIRRLIKMYSGEAVKYKEMLKDFSSLSGKIIKQMDTETGFIKKLADKNPDINKNRGIVEIFYRFARDKRDTELAIKDINELISGGDIPRYSDAKAIVQKIYNSAKTDMQIAANFLNKNADTIKGLNDSQKKYLKNINKRCQPLAKNITEELSKFSLLPELDLEKIYDQVKPKNAKTIVVETPTKAKVLSFGDVWTFPRRQQGNPNKPVIYQFNGEAAISSAILALTEKEKSAVIFVHAGPPDPIKPSFTMMRMAQPPFGKAKAKLEEANFIVKSWDMLATNEPPTVKAKRKIYVVIPARAQRPQPGRPPMGGYKQKNINKIAKLIDEGNPMVFLVKFAPPMMTKPYAFTKLLKEKFGINAETGKMILQGRKIRDQVIPDNRIIVSRYAKNEITNPIQSLTSIFQWALPLTNAKKIPSGVTISPLITVTSKMGNYWAESNIFLVLQRGWAKKDKGDLDPPFNLAVAVKNKKTGEKAVIFGNDSFATDQVADQKQCVLTAQGIGAVSVNPGNLELFANSIFWLNDNKNLIAVGPRTGDVPRIENISESGMRAWKIFLWVIWPLSALLLGGIVYLFRRK